MTLRHLKIFIAVVDLGSMTAASEALFIAQPTVSQAIAEIENYYKVKLFDRISRRLYITETGKQVLSYARHITALFEEMEQLLKNPDKSGILKIGASVTVGACLLPQLVNEFARVYPSLRIEAIINNTKDVENLIAKNAIDFGVVEGFIHSPDFISQAFMDDEVVLVAGRNHPYYYLPKISVLKLERCDFIVRERGSGTRELFESVMTAKDINWHLKWECNNPDGIKNAVLNGIGVSFISRRLVTEEVQSGKLAIIEVDGLALKRKFCVVYHKNKYLTNSMKDFFKLCYALSSESSKPL